MIKEDELKAGRFYRLKKYGDIEKLIYILNIEFCMQSNKNTIVINYSEVYGMFQTSVFCEDIQLIRQVIATKAYKQRMIEKGYIKKRGV